MFTVAADKAFWTATVFLVATLLLVIFAIRTPATAPQAVRRRAAEPATREASRASSLVYAE